MTDDQRAELEAMGEIRVRHLLSQSMLVHHLIVPAYEWLDELAKGDSDAARKG